MKAWIALIGLVSFSLLAQEVTPTHRLYQSLQFSDDLNFEHLEQAINRQLESYQRSGLRGNIQFGTVIYPKTILKDSLLLLSEITQASLECQKTHPKNICQDQFDNKLNEEFAVYIPKKNMKNGSTKFTSYYSPDLHGSRIQTDRFKRAIYRKPAPSHDNYTRVQIDYQGALIGQGYELFWVEESFYDLYLLHVQGGGRITIYDESGMSEKKYLSYDGKNNRSFQMIYHYMIQNGYLTANNAGISAQRKFLETHPEKEEEIFSSCPSYVYFKESGDEPVGLDNIPLTVGRSLAIDKGIYKTTGMINFVKTVRASHVDENGKVVKMPFSRFFISQDTGGAIRGSARCDLYFGYGPQAELTAYNMNEIGEQYFLIKKLK